MVLSELSDQGQAEVAAARGQLDCPLVPELGVGDAAQTGQDASQPHQRLDVLRLFPGPAS